MMAWTIYPWATMAIGEVVFIPGRTVDQAKAAKWHALRRPTARGKRFRIRTRYNGGWPVGVELRRVE